MMYYSSYDGKRREVIVTDAIMMCRHYYDGKCYEFTVTAQQQAGCPKWDTEKEANPPVPATEALAKAREFIATIKTENGFWWEMEDLALANIDGWMWRARYRLVRHGAMAGVPGRMECWILMDGTVVQPKITKDEK